MKTIGLFAIAFSLLFLAACQAPAEQATETPTGTEPAAAQESPQEETPPVAMDTTVKKEFASALNGNLEYTAQYIVTTFTADDSVDSQMTQYVKVNKESYNVRTDIESDGTTMRMLVVDDTYTSCVKTDKWRCVASTKTQDTKSPQQNAQEAANDDASTVVADGKMNVAGTSATCYLVSGKNGSARYCLSAGVPLYVKTMDSAGEAISELTAISYVASVGANDFEPPPASKTANSNVLPEGFDITTK